MRLKFLFVVGLGIGYVLGAKAGRGRYERLKTSATDAWEDPRVQKMVAETEEFVKDSAPIVQAKVSEAAAATVTSAKAAAQKAADRAGILKERVADTVEAVRNKVSSTVSDSKGKGGEALEGAIRAVAEARERALEDDVDEEDDVPTS